MTPAAYPARTRGIDALRGAAALMVVAFHGGSLVALPAAAGHDPLTVLRSGLDLGVELFFVLSGYLVGGPFVRAVRDGRHPGAVAEYALRRAARILPAWWMLLAATLALEGFATGDLPRVALHAVLLQGVVPGETFGIVDLAWTLSVEALFYMVAPVAAWLVLRRWPGGVGPRTVALWLLVIGAISAALATVASARWGGSPGGLLVTNGLPGCLALFVPGMLLAALERTRGADRLAASPVRRLAAAVAGLLLAVGATILAEGGSLDYGARNALAAAGFGLVVTAVVLAPTVARGALPAPLGLLAVAGTVSYGIYLWHSLVATTLRAAGFHVGAAGAGGTAWMLATCVLLVPTLVLATLSWRLVERPAIERAALAIRSRRIRARSRRGVPPTTAPVTSPLR